MEVRMQGNLLEVIPQGHNKVSVGIVLGMKHVENVPPVSPQQPFLFSIPTGVPLRVSEFSPDFTYVSTMYILVDAGGNILHFSPLEVSNLLGKSILYSLGLQSKEP